MKKVYLLLIILIITGCSLHSQVVVKSKVCSVPARVELSPLDNSTHLASKKNTAILMLNIADLVAYVKSLESALRCYQAQGSEATQAFPDRIGRK